MNSFLVFLLFAFLLSCADGLRHLHYFVPEDRQLCLDEAPAFFTPNNYLSYLFVSYITYDLDNSHLGLISRYSRLVQHRSNELLNKIQKKPEKIKKTVNIGVLCPSKETKKMPTKFFKSGWKELIESGEVSFNLTIFGNFWYDFESEWKIDHNETQFSINFVKLPNKEKIFAEDIGEFEGLKVSSYFLNDPAAYREVIEANLNLFTNPMYYDMNIFVKSEHFFENVAFFETAFWIENEELMLDTFLDCDLKFAPYERKFRFFSNIGCPAFQYLAHNAWVANKLLDASVTGSEPFYGREKPGEPRMALNKVLFIESHFNADLGLRMRKLSLHYHNIAVNPFSSKFLDEKIFLDKDIENFFHSQHIHKYLLWADPENRANVFNTEFIGKNKRLYHPDLPGSKPKDVIVTVAVNYKSFENHILLFVMTARKSHDPSEVDIAILVNEELVDKASVLFKEYQVIIVPFWESIFRKYGNKAPKKYDNLIRFRCAFEFLRGKSYRRILFADGNDSLFQKNVFFLYPQGNEDYILSNMVYDIQTNMDRSRMMNYYYQSTKNLEKKILPLHGVFAISFNYGTERSNAGSIGGDLTTFLWLSLMILEEAEELRLFKNIDQINYNYFLVKWSRTILPAYKMTNGLIFLSLAGTRPRLGVNTNCVDGALSPDGQFLFNGRAVPLIHNYDQLMVNRNPAKRSQCSLNLDTFLNQTGYSQLVGNVIFKEQK